MPADMQLLLDKLQQMKNVYEEAIRKGENTGFIRSQGFITPLHKYVITELKKMVEPSWVTSEKKIYGFPKTKKQDIIIQPPQDDKKNVSVGPIMAVNVRSQMSSIGKNYDTLFERLFAESLNLHNRFPYMVLGYLYLLPKVGYDPVASREKRVELSERYELEKYIYSFLSIAGRVSPSDEPWKYEKVCLLIVDFESDPPRVMDDMQTLQAEGLVSEKFARLYTFKNLAMKNFFDELYKIMIERYHFLKFRQDDL